MRLYKMVACILSAEDSFSRSHCSDVLLKPERLEDLINSFLRRLLGVINPEPAFCHRRTQDVIEILRPLFANKRHGSPWVTKLRNNIHAWRQHHHREGHTLQICLQVLPTLPENDIVEHHCEPGLQERPSKETHVLQTQAKLSRFLSARLPRLFHPLAARHDHMLEHIRWDMDPSRKLLGEQ